MKLKIIEFLSKYEEDVIVYPIGATYVEKEGMFDIFRRKPKIKIIKITFDNKKGSKR